MADFVDRNLRLPLLPISGDIPSGSSTVTQAQNFQGDIPTPKEPTGIMMDATFRGKDVTIYSTTGQRRTEADFEKALKEYDDSGQIPKGFTVLAPGALNTLRQGFEAVNQPLQRGAEATDQALGTTNRTILGQRPDLLPAPLVSAINAIRAKMGKQSLGQAQPQPDLPLAQTLASQVNTPEKAAATAASLAVAPLIGPGTGLAKAALMGGTAGATGYAAGRAAGGQGFDLGNTANEFALYALGGGTQKVVSGFLTKYLTPDRAQEVAGKILDTFKTKYPELVGRPEFFDAALSNTQNVERITQMMGGSLRGQLDDVTKGLVDEVKSILPRAFSNRPGEQGILNRLENKMRNIAELGNDVLNNYAEPAAYAKAKVALNKATNELVDWIPNTLGSLKGMQPNQTKLVQLLQDQMFQLDKFNEGAEVLGLLKQAGQEGGWNPVKIAQTMRNVYQRNPGSMTNQVGDIIAGGKPNTLTDLPFSQDTNKAEGLRRAANFLKSFVPGVKHLPDIPAAAAPRPMLPWQAPVEQGQLMGYTGGAVGREAIRKFAEE